MDQIDIIGEECMEAKDLIRKMISRESKKRPDAGNFFLLNNSVGRCYSHTPVLLGRTETAHVSHRRFRQTRGMCAGRIHAVSRSRNETRPASSSSRLSAARPKWLAQTGASGSTDCCRRT